jgi:hypothetical protein
MAERLFATAAREFEVIKLESEDSCFFLFIWKFALTYSRTQQVMIGDHSAAIKMKVLPGS